MCVKKQKHFVNLLGYFFMLLHSPSRILRLLNVSQNQANSAIFTRARKFSELPQIFSRFWA